MSIAQRKERYIAATATVNSLRERLNQKRVLLLDTDGSVLVQSFKFYTFRVEIFYFLGVHVMLILWVPEFDFCSSGVFKVTRTNCDYLWPY